MFTIKNGRLRMSVREVVEFICRNGDIDTRYSTMSADNDAMIKGTKIHKKIQKKMGADYVSEVMLKLSIPIEVEEQFLELAIEGRADGIYPEGDITTIDEIKSTYREMKFIDEPYMVHKAQAMCYAYMHAVSNSLDKIGITMTYCNIDTEEIKRFNQVYSFEEISEWFLNLIEELKIWIEFYVKAKSARDISIKPVEFPFEYREGQRDLTVGVYKTISRRKNLFIQAPTGVGKTMSTVYPTVKAMGEGLCNKIFYLTAKTITRTVASETFHILSSNGMQIRYLVITAKDKICFCDKKECNPVNCEYAKGHYDRVNSAVYDVITHEYNIDREKIEEYARKHMVCPFEMGLDVSYWCDAVICDYNYVFDPNVYLKRFFSDGEFDEDYVFLIDEAHNLVDRAREMFSAKICKEELMLAEKMVKHLDRRLSGALSKCNKDMLALKRECDDYEVINSCGGIGISAVRLQGELERFMEENRNFNDDDFLKDLYFQVRHFNNMQERLDENYIIYTSYNEMGDFFIKLFCVNPAFNLYSILSRGRSTVFFSATLLPVNYYKELLSTTNEEDYAIYVDSPFEKDKRLIAISRDVTSKYTRRNVFEYTKIAKYIKNITIEKKGNYMVFFPSYKYMQDVYGVLCEQNFSDADIVMQKNEMDETEREEFLQMFAEEREKSLVALCVLGGVFSEGIDLKRESLIGSIIVGTGLPMVGTEREILRKYYDDKSGEGYEYAYVYPGINKVLQAAGRVIRTEEDYGIITVLDERILGSTYNGLLPREWDDVYSVNADNIGELVKSFWEHQKKAD